MVKLKKKTDAVPRNYGEDFGSMFQAHILACAARIPDFILRRRDVLDHRYFLSDTHRTIAEVLLAHVDAHSILPSKPTLYEEVRQAVGEEDLEVTVAALNDLFTEDVQDHKAVEDRVIEFGKRQAMLNAVLEGAEKIDRGEPAAVEPLIRAAMLVGEDMTNVGTDFVADLTARMLRYRNPEAKNTNKIPTGIAHLDYLLQGGSDRGTLSVLLAPPKRGKTTMLINIGFGALTDLDGLNVFHYTCEMSERQVVRRYDDRLMGNGVKTRSAKPVAFSNELKRRVGRAVHGRLIVKEYPTRTATVATLRSHLSVMVAQGMLPDLVIVDYAGILKPSGRRFGDVRHEQASIFEDLRTLAGEFNCAVWTAHQANRGSLDKDTLTMADASETFEVGAVCDAMFAVCQTIDERTEGICRLFAAALREVEDGVTVNCRIRRDICRVTSFSITDASLSKIPTNLDVEDPDADSGEVDTKVEKLAKARKATGSSGTSEKSKKSLPSKKVHKKR